MGHIADICKRLATARRSIRFEKAQCAHPRVKFLGFNVGNGSVTPIPSVVAVLLRPI